MKKLAILAAVLMLIPASVMAGMNILNESSLNDVTGQVGITINQSTYVTGGYLAYTDSDGYGTVTATDPGVLVLDGLEVTNTAGTGAMKMSGLTVDVGTTTTGARTSLFIGLPTITGRISLGNICLGSTVGFAQTNDNLGAVEIGNLTMSGSTLEIYAH